MMKLIVECVSRQIEDKAKERDQVKVDKDGLLCSRSVTKKDGRFFIDDEEIFVAPECRGVISYVLQHSSLWEKSRFRYNQSDIRKKGAPIIGVPFSRALKQALQDKHGFQKSMFEIPGWTSYKGKAVIATMLVHTTGTSQLVELEAWQMLDISDETIYIHCIIDRKTTQVIHFDGATMCHTESQRENIRKYARKIKGEVYQKHFRLDGSFGIDQAAMLMDLYFPIQPLTSEFLDCIRG